MPFKDYSRLLESLDASEAIQISGQIQNASFNGVFRGIHPESFPALLQIAKTFSVAPISGFHVGAVVIGKHGDAYLGANMEFNGVPLNTSLHAEQSAILNAWMHGEKSIQSLYISETPCGHCREFLRELSGISEVSIIINDQVTHLDALLPQAFGAARPEGKGLLDSGPVRLEPVHPTDENACIRAINSAQHSYCPYTHNPVGCVLETVSGKFIAGRSAESAAFNPSVPAIVCALNQRNLSHLRNEIIQSCIIAKLATGIHSQQTLTSSLLNNISHTQIRTVLLEPI